MNKKNIIIAAIIVVILAALVSYYFFYYIDDSPQLTEEARQVEQEQEETQKEKPEEAESEQKPEQKEEVDEQAEQDKQDEENEEEQDKQDEEGVVKEESEVKEIIMAGEYKYREKMRDPFFEIKKKSNVQDQSTQKADQDEKKEKIEVVADPQLTIEDLKVPFRLDGIIEQSSQSIAIVATSEGSRFMRKNESIGEYDVLNVGDERIEINYQNLTFYMEIGGALVEK